MFSPASVISVGSTSIHKLQSDTNRLRLFNMQRNNLCKSVAPVDGGEIYTSLIQMAVMRAREMHVNVFKGIDSVVMCGKCSDRHRLCQQPSDVEHTKPRRVL